MEKRTLANIVGGLGRSPPIRADLESLQCHSTLFALGPQQAPLARLRKILIESPLTLRLYDRRVKHHVVQ